MDNCLIKFSRCCNPLPGDEIIGFITRGFGVSIHKRSCSNVPADLASCAEPERWVKAHWAEEVHETSFKSTLELVADDRPGLLVDITQQIFNLPAVCAFAQFQRDQKRYGGDPRDDYGERAGAFAGGYPEAFFH